MRVTFAALALLFVVVGSAGCAATTARGVERAGSSSSGGGRLLIDRDLGAWMAISDDPPRLVTLSASASTRSSRPPTRPRASSESSCGSRACS